MICAFFFFFWLIHSPPFLSPKMFEGCSFLVSRPSSSGFFCVTCFLLLLFPVSFLSYIAPWIYFAFIQLAITLLYNSVTASLCLQDVAFGVFGSFHSCEGTVIHCLTPCTSNLCAFSVTSGLKILRFVLTFLLSSPFTVSLKLGWSASFISTFLSLHAMVINERTLRDKFLRPMLKSSNSHSF